MTFAKSKQKLNEKVPHFSNLKIRHNDRFIETEKHRQADTIALKAIIVIKRFVYKAPKHFAPL